MSDAAISALDSDWWQVPGAVGSVFSGILNRPAPLPKPRVSPDQYVG